MTAARTFGRKGGALPQPAPAPGPVTRRAAFQPVSPEDKPAPPPRAVTEVPEAPPRTPRADDKRPAVAYGLWLAMCLVGAHRHYLGLHLSALLQALLPVIGLATLLVDARIAFTAFGLLAAWLLIDLALIPILCRQANRRADDKRAFAGI